VADPNFCSARTAPPIGCPMRSGMCEAAWRCAMPWSGNGAPGRPSAAPLATVKTALITVVPPASAVDGGGDDVGAARESVGVERVGSPAGRSPGQIPRRRVLGLSWGTHLVGVVDVEADADDLRGPRSPPIAYPDYFQSLSTSQREEISH
jgi:hypothetical protein